MQKNRCREEGGEWIVGVDGGEKRCMEGGRWDALACLACIRAASVVGW